MVTGSHFEGNEADLGGAITFEGSASGFEAGDPDLAGGQHSRERWRGTV